ncbi:phenylalanine--tRNA ligase, chloroplastic/mitochondrial-like [Momordica charantia]|uniref:Phenylalanine--tRNA ligase, chloroplastic/mitochondrial-like n=1 Tax=Momordica charantia TaxID=3673 RepID=A0A6J1DXU6_MOMCH|nr:phenylalanine--tRNA ligase, chloroplastic/mitochondrial-like [Momordica charantia]
MASALPLTRSILFTNASNHLRSNCLRSFTFSASFSSSSPLSSDTVYRKKWRQPVSSLLELGGVVIAKDDIVRDDPTINVPDNIFKTWHATPQKR